MSVRSDAECMELKQMFEERYVTYQELNRALAENAADFERMEASYHAAAEDRKELIAIKMKQMWSQVRAMLCLRCAPAGARRA